MHATAIARALALGLSLAFGMPAATAGRVAGVGNETCLLALLP